MKCEKKEDLTSALCWTLQATENNNTSKNSRQPSSNREQQYT